MTKKTVTFKTSRGKKVSFVVGGPKKPNMWIKFSKKMGYLKKGKQFEPIPKKGTDDYKELNKGYKEYKKKLA